MITRRDFVSPATADRPRAVWYDGLLMYVKLGIITLDEAKAIADEQIEDAAVRHILNKIEKAE